MGTPPSPARSATRSWSAAAVLLAMSAACSDADTAAGGAPAAGSGSPAPAERCRDDCETYARCQGFPASGCEGSLSCGGWPSARWREEVAAAYRDCQRGCPADPTACTTAAFAAAGNARDVDMHYATACAAAGAACPEALDNDACGEESLYEAAAVTSALACFDQACAQVQTCLDAAFER